MSRPNTQDTPADLESKYDTPDEFVPLEAPEDQDDLSEYYPQPLVAQPYVSVVADQVMQKTKVENRRPLINFTLSQRRYEFTRNVSLSDRHMPDKIAEYRRQQIPEFSLPRMQIDNSFQATHPVVNASTQTAHNRKLNKAIQYAPLNATPEQCRAELEKFASSGGLKRTSALIEEALFESTTIDPYINPLNLLVKYSSGLGNRVEQFLRPVHTLYYSPPDITQTRSLSSIAWHPTLPGMIAFVNSEPVIDDWKMSPTTIVAWDLNDLLRPKAVFEAPDAVTCLCWAASLPNVLVAGLVSGQLCVFELQNNIISTFSLLLDLSDGNVVMKHPLQYGNVNNALVKSAMNGPALTNAQSGSQSSGSNTMSDGTDDQIGVATPQEIGFSYDNIQRPSLCPSLPHPTLITSENELLARSKDDQHTSSSSNNTNNTDTTDATANGTNGKSKQDTDDMDSMNSSNNKNVSNLQPQLPVCVSVAERSHSKAVVDIQALSGDVDLNGRGELLHKRTLGDTKHNIFVSVGSDGKLLFWDLAQLKYNDTVEKEHKEKRLRQQIEEQELQHKKDMDAKQAMNSIQNPIKTSAADAYELKKQRLREKSKQNADSNNTNNSTNPEEEEEVPDPFVLNAVDNTNSIMQILESSSCQWQPFHQQTLTKPGGGVIMPVSLRLNDDFTFSVGSEAGEICYGRYATTTSIENDIYDQAHALLDPNNSSIANNTDLSINNSILELYTHREQVFTVQVPIGDGNHAPKNTPLYEKYKALNANMDSETDTEGDEISKKHGYIMSTVDKDDDDTSSSDMSKQDKNDTELTIPDDSTVFSAEELALNPHPCLERVVPVLPCQVSISRSPFYSDLYLAVGTWQFCLWQRDCPFPVYVSPMSNVEYTSGEWSPSRPSVVILITKAGSIHIVDFLDKATKPHVSHVSSSPLVSLSIWSTYTSSQLDQLTNTDHTYTSVSTGTTPIVCIQPNVQLIAAGDSTGKLHVLELSQYARMGSKNDIVIFRRLLRQEIRRLRYKLHTGTYTPLKTRCNLTSVLHSLDNLGLTLIKPKHDDKNNANGVNGTTNNDQDTPTSSSNSSSTQNLMSSEEWTDADEHNENAYQQLLKEWKAKLATAVATDE